jgi:hypothetical protein
MKKTTIAVTAFALSLVPTATMAQERAGDAALGAVSGAVVLGPVGAVAGALIGYTTGPSISRSWGLRGSNRAGRTTRSARRSSRYGARAAASDSDLAQRNQATAPAAVPPAPAAASVMPPVQPLE